MKAKACVDERGGRLETLHAIKRRSVFNTKLNYPVTKISFVLYRKFSWSGKSPIFHAEFRTLIQIVSLTAGAAGVHAM